MALVAIVASGALLAVQRSDFNDGWFGWGYNGDTWGGGVGMMGGSGYGWLPGEGEPVDGLTQARDRAAEYAETLDAGLQVGEVMQFSNHYYAELQAADGTNATEVLVNPDNGAVQLEFGPARMWNTRFGMMGRGYGYGNASAITASEASRIAEEWLGDRDEGLTADTPEEFPGYYTLHTLQGGEVVGMLSVNSVTGDVWYHSWHGDFQRMSEDS